MSKMPKKGYPKVILEILLLTFLLACSTPARRVNELANQLGFNRQILQGTNYLHVVYRNNEQGNLLHVYLGGDGTPWLNHTRIAADPTPRNPLTLQLMAQDNAPSLYLGRPCYHGQSHVPPCNPLLWTSQRYGSQIIDSMAAVLEKILEREHYRHLVFIGYSGGGVLAMLLAERFEQTRAVVTIAGNLDPDRWAAWHGYSPLKGSLNPAHRPPLPPGIVQLHYAGGHDKNVPPSIARTVVQWQHCSYFIIIESFDHICCWKTTWPTIMERLQQTMQRCK